MKLRVDSPVIALGIKLTNLLILNFYFLLGCLPVVTAGASAIAAFTVTLKMSEEREGVSMSAQFWTAWVHNLRHGIPLTLILLAAVYSAWIDYQAFQNLSGNPVGFLILAVALLALVLIHFLYVFPLEARYENGLAAALANSRRIASRFFLRSLSLVGILVLQVLLFTQVAPVLTYIGIFTAPILMIYTTSQIAMPIFRKIEQNDTASDGFAVGAATER